MLLYARVAEPKRISSLTRSRAGCKYCKTKKKKCSESLPSCARCIERGLQCTYDAIKPRRGPGPPPSSPTTSVTRAQKSPVCDGYDILERLSFYEGQGEVSRGGSNLSQPVRQATRLEYRLPHPFLDFYPPAFNEFSEDHNRRKLMNHFCSVLSHVMVFKEDTGNPFRQLVIPLATADSPVLDAIFAFSSAHLEHKGGFNKETGLSFHTKALEGISRLIEAGDESRRSELLATIMLLIYYEVVSGDCLSMARYMLREQLVQCEPMNIVSGHIKGAMAIMDSHTGKSSPMVEFLKSAFSFFDVITALSHCSSPISAIPKQAEHQTSSGASDESSQFHSVDTLLGMATDLWPMMHRLSDLVVRRQQLQDSELAGLSPAKTERLHSSVGIESAVLGEDLRGWQCPIRAVEEVPVGSQASTLVCAEQRRDSCTRLNAIVCNAEAYRQAALVHLHRHIDLTPRASIQVQQHTRRALEACKYVAVNSGPMSALLWPLFIASCEAIADEDRTTAKFVFRKAMDRQGMVNIEKAWDVVDEVWRRSDESGVDVSWLEVCRFQGIRVVLG